MKVFYNQLGIGDCGHIVMLWPQISNGSKTYVFCDTCARAEYGIDDSEQFFVVTIKAEYKRRAASVRGKRPPKRKSPMRFLLEQEGLF